MSKNKNQQSLGMAAAYLGQVILLLRRVEGPIGNDIANELRPVVAKVEALGRDS